MTSEKDLIKQLRILRNTPTAVGLIDVQTKERIFKTITAQIQYPQRPSAWQWGIFQYFVPPSFVYAIGILAFLITSGTVAIASRNALPGETLYSAKLAVEKAQVRLTSNPARRAVVQMELAGNRLKEVRQIKKEGGIINGRVDSALSRFAKDVTEVNGVLKQAGDPDQVKTATSEITQKATEYKQELINSGFIVPLDKKQIRNVDLATIEKAEQALQEVGVIVIEEEEESAEPLEDGQVGL